MVDALNGLSWSDIHISNKASSPQQGTTGKIATLNILGFPGDMACDPDIGGLTPWKQRTEKIKSALSGFDVICVQEVLGDLGRALESDPHFASIRQEYPEIHVTGSTMLGFPGGLAVLSKHKIDKIETISLETKIADGHWMNRCFTMIKIEKTVLVNTHLASGEKDKTGSTARFFGGRELTIQQVRDAQAEQILKKLNDDYADCQCYVMGDTNCNGLDNDEYKTFPLNPANGRVTHCVTQDGDDHGIEQIGPWHKIIKKSEFNEACLEDLYLTEDQKNAFNTKLAEKNDSEWVQPYQILREILPLKDAYRTSSTFWGQYATIRKQHAEWTEKQLHEATIEWHNKQVDQKQPYEESLDRIVYVGSGKTFQGKMTPMYDITKQVQHQISDHHRLETEIVWA